MSRQPETFCSSDGVRFGDPAPETAAAMQSLLVMDGSRHAALRRLVATWFSSRRARALEGAIGENARGLVDAAAPLGSGDFVELIARRLPLLTLCEILGVRSGERPSLLGDLERFIIATDDQTEEASSARVEAGMRLHARVQELIAARRREPREDLLSAVVHGDVASGGLSRSEITAFVFLLVAAGNDPPRQAVSLALHALGRFPDQRAWLVDDLAGRLPSAVEELIRWGTPVMALMRTAALDTELRGQPIAAGDRLALFYTSANRDEAVFEDPDTLRLNRRPNPHVGFGGGGPHHCLGAAFARAHVRAALRETLTGLRDIEVGEPEFALNLSINHVVRLPCSWSA